MKRWALLAAGLMGGCATASGPASESGKGQLQVPAVAAGGGIMLDGRLDEPAWRAAAVVSLARVGGGAPVEGCEVLLLVDREFLYVGARVKDLDVVQELQADQRHHYTAGDVFEVFIRPAGSRAYWEFFAAPGGWKTSQFFPSKGRLGLPSSMDYPSRLQVATEVQGSLNEMRDEDRGWTVEMMIPLDQLSGSADDTGEIDVLFGRYNYGRQLDALELSSWPGIPVANFHDAARHARVRLSGGAVPAATRPVEGGMQK